MLFYIKRHLWLEVTLTILLASLGPRGMHALNLPLHLKPRPFNVVVGVLGAASLGVWTLLVQYGYRIFKGNAFAERLTASLAMEYVNPHPAQILLGGLTAAWGELLISAEKTSGWLATGQSFRVCTSVSFFAYSKNLMVPMIAHGLFDMGGMVYFRSFMLRLQNKQV
jgi:hypothetical protein